MKLLAELKEDLRYEISGLFFLALAVLGGLGLFDGRAGVLGRFSVRLMRLLLGDLAPLVPFALGWLGLALIFYRRRFTFGPRPLGGVLLFVAGAAFFHLGIPPGLEFENGWRGFGGGLVGAAAAWVFLAGLGASGRYVGLVFLALVGLLLLTGLSLKETFRVASTHLGRGWTRVQDFWTQRKKGAERLASPLKEAGEPPLKPLPAEPGEEREVERLAPSPMRTVPTSSNELKKEFSAPRRREEKFPLKTEEKGEAKVETKAAAGPTVSWQQLSLEDNLPFQLPPLGLLERGQKAKGTRGEKEIADKVRLLETTLETFGVKARVVEVSRGPTVTRFEVQPAPGVKVSKVVSLADDIALSLAAQGVRIEAPIPGKSAIGIEVPNQEVSLVRLREVLETPDFQNSTSPLTVALGKDIAGRPVVASLEKTLHLLIAGATGSGKSVCVNSIIASILFKATPREVRFLLIDPKVVELNVYNRIPHLLAPVVTDPKKVAGALRWVLGEMARRWELFAENGVRDINRFNQLQLRGGTGDRLLPYIVVVMDELADLMMVAPVDVEDAITRLAQMGRAAGIHLVVATQRPSVDVITGTIKANIPSRIAFAVSSQVDSRTILDMGGAEKLLGKGDMLIHLMGFSKPIRAQGAFISETEVEAIVDHWARQGQPQFEEGVLKVEEEESSPVEDEDDLFREAVRVVVESGQASVSLLQRRLRIGYARAGRLVDAMEERGIVGPYEGAKPREVKISLAEYQRLFGDTRE